MTTRAELEQLDREDPLAPFRERFFLPDGVVYLDGNSLGALPREAAARVEKAVREEWGNGLIRSWDDAGWMELPARVGAKIGRLVGAEPGSVVCADSTSVNLFKVLAVALGHRADRKTILTEPGNFPTDLYVAEGLAKLVGKGHRLRLEPAERIVRAIDPDTAVVLLTQVDYRSGARHDLGEVTRAAHEKGALVVWDLSHSAGAFEVDLAAAGADFAVGCGYKYLCGGPGAPAYVYVAPRHQRTFSQPLAGWLGHVAPFAFESAYRPAPGVGRYVAGTPPVLSMTALEAAVELLLEAGMAAVREKSVRMTSLFVELAEERLAGNGLVLASPRDPERRGSQVSLSHPRAGELVRALGGRGVLGDFRPPDLLRFGFAPVYNRYVELWDAVEALGAVLAGLS